MLLIFLAFVLDHSDAEDYRVWYVLFIEFVTYAMLPLQLRWCLASAVLTAALHIITLLIHPYDAKNSVSFSTPSYYPRKSWETILIYSLFT